MEKKNYKKPLMKGVYLCNTQLLAGSPTIDQASRNAATPFTINDVEKGSDDAFDSRY